MKAYRPSAGRIPELNGLRVLLVFIVSWYHFWQQSWLTPHIGDTSLDFLVRSGYMPVDGTILLSGFLLFLPHARSMLLGDPVPDTRSFYERRVMRIVPSYYFVTLLMLFAVAIPYDLYYGNTAQMWEDVLRHLTFTQTFDFYTYISTPIGVASWTIAIEMQAYLIFPLLAKAARKQPLGTLALMALVSVLFRGWCVWEQSSAVHMITGTTSYNMVVNQLISFLDVYAIGMAAAIVYVKLTTLYPDDKRRFLWQAAATIAAVIAVMLIVNVLRAQAGEGSDVPRTDWLTSVHGSITHGDIQAGQMMRRPVFSVLLAVLTVALPFTVRPLRFLMGNRAMGFLAMVSMNYYLIHQNLAVHLKRIRFPAFTAEYPQMAGPEQPWAYQYTAACFGLSLLMAILITFLIEKPCAWALGRLFGRLNAALDAAKEKRALRRDENRKKA